MKMHKIFTYDVTMCVTNNNRCMHVLNGSISLAKRA